MERYEVETEENASPCWFVFIDDKKQATLMKIEETNPHRLELMAGLLRQGRLRNITQEHADLLLAETAGLYWVPFVKPVPV